MFSISEFVKNVGSELNTRCSHRRMSLPEVQDTDNRDERASRLRSIARRLHVYLRSLPEEHGRRHAVVEAWG